MDYNTQLPKLILPEYGRNIQMMVQEAKQIEDKGTRNKYARVIISVMGNMYPHLRDINDFKHKLWDHLQIMADFDIDIDSPYPIPTRESFQEKPKKVPYDNRPIKYKYHGKIIEKLIDKATEIEDKAEQKSLIEIIANHMKKSYLMWNKEVVNDDVIFKTIDKLSGGKLEISSTLTLSHSKDLFSKNKRKRVDKDHKKRSKTRE